MGKITGKGSYAFYGLETTWKSNTSTGVRQAFNPMEKLPVPKTPPKTTLVRTFDSRNPTIAFTTHIEPGEITYEGNYKDPFLMMSFFTAKYITGVEAGTPASAWSTGTEGTGLISGSFETDDNESTIYMQVHGDDRAGASDIDKRFHGGLVGNYIWKIAKQSLLKESATIKFMSGSSLVQAFLTDADFDDGYFSHWDKTITGGVHPKDMGIEFGAKAISGLSITDLEVKIDAPRDIETTFDSLTATDKWLGNQDLSCTINGIFADSSLIDELYHEYNNKTIATLKIFQVSGTSFDKYIQMTNMFVDDVDSMDIEGAGTAVKGSITFLGGTGCEAKFIGYYASGLTDPTARIDN